MQKQSLYLLSLLTLLTPAAIQAADLTWTGDTDQTWSTDSNWNPNGVPTNGDVVRFLTNSSQYTTTEDINDLYLSSFVVSSSVPYTFNSAVPQLFLQSGAGISINLFGDTAAHTFNLPLGLEGPLDLRIDHYGGTATFASPISGSPGVVIDHNSSPNGGVVVFSGTNTYSGHTIVKNGAVLQIDRDENLSVFSNGLILDQGTLKVTNVINLTLPITINSGGGTFDVESGVLLFHSNTANPLNVTATTITKTGLGGLFLTGSGVNTYNSTPIIVSQGTLGGTTDTMNTDIINNSLVQFIQSTTGSFTHVISESGSVAMHGPGVVNFTEANTYTGGTSIAGGTLALVGSGALYMDGSVDVNSSTTPGATFSISGVSAGSAFIGSLTGVAGTQVILGSNTLSVNIGSAATFNGVISGSGGAIVKQGASTWTLTGVNTYTGGTTIGNGTLALVDSGALDSSGDVNIASTGAIFDISGISTGATSVGALMGMEDSQTVLGSKTLNVNVEALATFGGVISGSGGAIVKQGASTWTLTGVNTYTGGTSIAGGTLALTDSGSLSSSGSVDIAGSSFFDISGISVGATSIGALTGNVGSQMVLGSKKLNVNVGTSATFNGAISGSGGAITKQGAGTWILTGANTYTGGTSITSGTLALASSGALDSFGNVNIASSGATFDISGISVGVTAIGALTGVTGSQMVLGSKTLNVDVGVSTTFDGVISGLGGAIVKKGAGTWTLTGTNTYSGGTTISAGVLRGNATSLQGNISNAGTLIFDQTVAGTYAYSLSGGGSLIKQGPEELILSGVNAFTGNTEVNEGTLSVNGSILGTPGVSSVTVAPTARLQGGGVIQGNISNSGTVGPGNSIGTLTVDGDITFNGGSVFEVELDPAHADNLINITGSMTILPGTTIDVIPAPAAYREKTTYQVVSATGGINGTFDTITNTYPLINVQVLYRPAFGDSIAGVTGIDILLSYDNFSTIITQGNAGSLVKTFSGINPAPGTDLYDVFQQLYLLNTAELNKALNQMQPSLTIGLTLAQQSNFDLIASALRKRTNALYEACCKKGGLSPRDSKSCGEKNRWNLWVDVSLGYYHQRSISYKGNPNFGFHSDSTIGATGLDYRFPANVYLGILGAYTHSDIDWSQSQADGRIHSYYGGIYSSWLNDYCFVNLSAVGAINSYSTSRKIEFGIIDRHAQARHGGASVESHIDFGFNSPRRSRFQISSWGELDYTYLHQRKYREHSANSLNLQVSKYNATILRSELGLQARYCIKLWQDFLIPSLKVSWIREQRFNGECLRARVVSVPDSFRVKGIYPSRSLFAPGAAVTGSFLDDHLNVSLTYEREFGHKVSFKKVNLSLIGAF